MRYTVIWLYPALDQLTTLWNDGPDRNAVTAASHRIDIRLANDPLNEGESRGGSERITFESPLQLLFRVFETEQEVHVAEVRRFGRKP